MLHLFIYPLNPLLQDHPDFLDLQAAHQGIQEVTSYVNEEKRLAEQYQVLVVIESSMKGSLPIALPIRGRHLVRTGAIELKRQVTETDL